MNKFSKLFAGFAAVALFASCSNDDLLGNEDQQQPNRPDAPIGDTAYMRINISDVNAAAGKATPGDFQDGIYEEHAVSNAQFFFFDENGIFVQKGSIQDPDFGEDHQTPGPVEYIGKDNILVLEDLTAKSWPRYLLTVLNAPDFTPESTLKATAEKLDHYTHKLQVKKDNQNLTLDCMVMSTSSFFGTGSNDFADSNHNNAYPYVTQLKTGDFYLSAADATANGNAVKIYVERLAAKVQLSLSASLQAGAKVVNGKTLYKLTQTVAGSPNDEENPSASATTDLYLEIEGWNLSGIATQSHLSKILNGTDGASWNTTAWNTAWNDETNFRSYWGKSALYGAEVTDVTAAYNDFLANPSTAAHPGLGVWYANYATDSKDFGADNIAYCNENTNTKAVVFKKDSEDRSVVVPAQTTHVVLKTRVCDKNGDRLDLVSYHGVLYLRDAYKQYVLNAIQAGNAANLNFYTTTDGVNFKQVDANFFVTNGTNAGVKIEIADKNATLYAKQDDGTFKADETLMASLQSAIDAWYTSNTSPATEYNGGRNVYYIPVEHAGNSTVAAGEEGFYGVVRNHWYNVSLNSFSRVGHGVFNPDEALVPGEPEDPLYYLGVNINVLSWKIVNQNVDL